MSSLPNLEALALRWCPRAERAEVIRTGERDLRVVVVGARIGEVEANALASVMALRLAPLGVAVDVEARSFSRPPAVAPHRSSRHGGHTGKLDRRVLEVLAEAPMTRAQLVYRLKIGPRHREGQRALSNSLYRLEHVAHKIEQRSRRFVLVDAEVPA